MLIKGYDAGPLVPGESLPARPGFWSNHLLPMCGLGGCAERPDPEWFGEDGADADALSDVLFDPGRWPVFRIPAEDGPGAVVIYRNLEGDYGTDYLLTQPGRSRAERIAGWDGDFSGTGLTWHELIRIADHPSPAAEGIHDTAVRFLLLLPVLTDPDVPESAPARLITALTAVGAAQDTASVTAEHLLAHLTKRSRHDPTWTSPLSGSQTPAGRGVPAAGGETGTGAAPSPSPSSVPAPPPSPCRCGRRPAVRHSKAAAASRRARATSAGS
ncbi:hypothetical protein GCM10010302_10000 [Streptomyces polychromogenes]|uniref:Uncharacterized protein n=1 Tax=Streptomyces polychromogenes TaxID=67342 RepID=A0ABN0V498_9ACTN